ncbi:MAG: hypothetical protein JRH10_00025 [Deltaproteobacteria bacterium]|nr:hypothetical protein [Deltaproteobacteria bacterium]MBW2444555.1 hypothetical protein [Deltaproteobacteria bacterium]
MPARPARTFALLVAALAVAGCAGARYERETFYENRDVTVTLRGRTDVNPGYEHPTQISAVRLSHILASLDVRFADQQKKNARTPVVPIEAIYPLGKIVSQALAKAKPEQEVVVTALLRTRKLKVFTDKTLTAFIVYMKNDQLVFHISRVGFTMPKNPNDRVHEPKQGKSYQDFKVLRSKSIVPIAPQAVAVEWRHPDFRKADAVRIGRGGKIKRRTVLIEEPEEEAPKETPADVVDISTLTSDALRQLADLEDERRRGSIGEAEYVARRRQILEKGAR